MMRFIMPLILIGISVTLFLTFANPMYSQISDLRAQVASYDEALDNEKSLEIERDKLTAKSNSISRDDLAKLQKLLPDGIDNIRLILEIQQIASTYGMALKDVKYSATDKDGKSTGSATGAAANPTGTPSPVAGSQVGVASKASSKDYGIWDLEFSTSGSYSNFLNFTRDLESNLRIVDVSSIQFASGSTSGVSGGSSGSASASDTYKYSFKIKTYWLKK